MLTIDNPINNSIRASLVAQWLKKKKKKTHLPV